MLEFSDQLFSVASAAFNLPSSANSIGANHFGHNLPSQTAGSAQGANSFEAEARLANDIIQATQEKMKAFASRSDFFEQMQSVFGNSINDLQVRNLQQDFLNQDWLMPSPVFKSDMHLRGAFDKESKDIYLNPIDPFTGKRVTTAESLVGTYAHELGHLLDDFLNPQDTPGDEGEHFARVIDGEKISSEEFSSIKSAVDLAQVSINGEWLNVEASGSDGAGNSFRTAKNFGNLSGKRVSHYDYVTKGGINNDPFDYFKFKISDTRRLMLALKDQIKNASVDIYNSKEQLINLTGNQYIGGRASEGGAFGDFIDIVLAPGTYYVKVSAPVNPSEATTYTLVINLLEKSVQPLTATQGISYFKDRLEFFGKPNNPFTQSGLNGSSAIGNGATDGNCVWYAWGRLREMGFNPDTLITSSKRNAGDWSNFGKGSQIITDRQSVQPGDIAQYSNGGYGHVAVVESVVKDRSGRITNVILSESHKFSDYDGDIDRDGKSSGTLHRIVNYSINNPTRFLRAPRL